MRGAYLQLPGSVAWIGLSDPGGLATGPEPGQAGARRERLRRPQQVAPRPPTAGAVSVSAMSTRAGALLGLGEASITGPPEAGGGGHGRS
jgi:hypothetical protein